MSEWMKRAIKSEKSKSIYAYRFNSGPYPEFIDSVFSREAWSFGSNEYWKCREATMLEF